MIEPTFDPRKPIEELVQREYREGVSAGAAARQLCRSLDGYPSLKRLLEDMLADYNQQNHEFMQEREALRDVLTEITKN